MVLTYQVVLLAVDPTVDVVEGFAAERPSAGAAYEAIGVIEIAHRLTSLSGAGHFLTTRMANACGREKYLLFFLQLRNNRQLSIFVRF